MDAGAEQTKTWPPFVPPTDLVNVLRRLHPSVADFDVVAAPGDDLLLRCVRMTKPGNAFVETDRLVEIRRELTNAPDAFVALFAPTAVLWASAWQGWRAQLLRSFDVPFVIECGGDTASGVRTACIILRRERDPANATRFVDGVDEPWVLERVLL